MSTIRFPYYYYAALTEAICVVEVQEDRVSVTVTRPHAQEVYTLSKDSVRDGCIVMLNDHLVDFVDVETNEDHENHVTMGTGDMDTVLYILLHAFFKIAPEVNRLSFEKHIDPRCRLFDIESAETYIDLFPISSDDDTLIEDIVALTLYRPMSMG